MNSKNFTAAEKHFEKVRVKLTRRIQELSDTLRQERTITAALIDENRQLKAENTQLNEWVERLLEYTQLSSEDIKAAIEKDKAVKQTAERLGTLLDFSSMLSGYGRY